MPCYAMPVDRPVTQHARERRQPLDAVDLTLRPTQHRCSCVAAPLRQQTQPDDSDEPARRCWAGGGRRAASWHSTRCVRPSVRPLGAEEPALGRHGDGRKSNESGDSFLALLLGTRQPFWSVRTWSRVATPANCNAPLSVRVWCGPRFIRNSSTRRQCNSSDQSSSGRWAVCECI